jgi:CRP-like cAMP-binding protein
MRRLLRRSAVLSALDEAETDRLLALARTRTFEPEELVFRKGDPPDALYGVLSGSVRAVTHSGDGKELVLRLMPAGEIVGEVALFDGGPRSASVVANERAELLVIERNAALALLEAQPRMAVKLLGAVSARLRSLTESFEDALFLALPRRLAKKLLELVDQRGRPEAGGVRIDLRLSQEALGSLLGMTRESINKQMRAWQNEGVVRKEGGFLVVVQPQRLAAIARGESGAE